MGPQVQKSEGPHTLPAWGERGPGFCSAQDGGLLSIQALSGLGLRFGQVSVPPDSGGGFPVGPELDQNQLQSLLPKVSNV